MQITAVRGTEARDRVYARRDDGSEVSWSWPSYGTALAHDLVHWVVESDAGLEHGLWGMVAAGVDPTRVNKAAERIATGIRLRDLSDRDLTELIQAEHLAACIGRTSWAGAEEAVAYVVEQCAEFGVPPVPGLTTAAVTRMVERADALNRRWQATPPDAGLVLAWPPSEGDP
jgi:hypothetical protein